MTKFDILIKNGSLADGSGSPLIQSDVGIIADRIAEIGNLAGSSATTEIDARDKIVSPGFVDIHGHSDYFILVEPGSRGKLLQGVTTEIGGNCGYSAAPISKKLGDERGESLHRNFGIRPDWTSLDEYYDRLAAIKPAINFGILIGHNTVRASVMAGAARPPNEKEKSAMIEMIVAGMRHGALGISTGLIYPPACFADKDELADMCVPAAKYGGFFATHIRSEGRALIESLEEVIGAAEKAKIRIEISHFKTSGVKNWGKIDAAIGLIEDARKRGVDARCDRYPYTASFTGLSSVLPSWVFEGSRDEFHRRLLQPEVRARLSGEIVRDNGEDYLSRVFVAQTFSDASHRLEGKSVIDAAKIENKNPFDFLFDILATEPSEPTAIYHTMNEDNMARILNLPYTSVGSDSSVRNPDGPLGTGKPHPRAYGTFPRMLRLVRERNIMPIETAVKKMTSLPAESAGIQNRGMIRAGWFADVVVFDPDKAADTATYDQPHKFPVGIEYVIVNGHIAAIGGEATGARAGRVLRKSVGG